MLIIAAVLIRKLIFRKESKIRFGKTEETMMKKEIERTSEVGIGKINKYSLI